ncbi:MAG: type II toxin-antitoxin system RelE/ParE family toxin [Candidatus Aquicultor sp.]|nr:type II toxin-antitoxin system RelE/ParE family toxin [Candidatus Aquicultor sp.]
MKKYRVLIRPEAEDDLREAFSWYEDKRRGLGHDFLLQVEAGLRFIERCPSINSPGYKETRNRLIKRFPYKIIYLTEESRVVVKLNPHKAARFYW